MCDIGFCTAFTELSKHFALSTQKVKCATCVSTSQVMDKHLLALAQDHLETKFVRVSLGFSAPDREGNSALPALPNNTSGNNSPTMFFRPMVA